MRMSVIEFELTCPEHGRHRIIVPLQSPWPQRCAHCFSTVERREVRRFEMEAPIPTSVGSEVWIG